MKIKAGAILSSIRIDREMDRKISVQLYMGLRDLILAGGVQPGERLPASRTLGSDLGVSRTTVIEALDRLIAEGLLEARVGSGTFVSTALAGQPGRNKPSQQASAPVNRLALSRATAHATRQLTRRSRLPHKSQAFITALPALDRFPMAHWARLSSRHWRETRDEVMGYGHPCGLPRLRSAIAAHLNASRGIHCDPEQILIVGGAQQAFSLIGTLLLDAGDKVWFENPGAIGARNAFIAQGAKLVPVSIDAEGLSVAEGLRKAPGFRLAFVTPSHQQPLGRVMSLARRLDLLKAAEDANALIVEDDYDGDFYYGHQPQPTLKSIDTQNRVIYVGTFSKSLFPSLRLGYLLAPDGLADTFREISSSFLSGVPTAPQAIVADFMEEGLFATHIRQMRRLYKDRHDALLDHAAKLRDWIDVRTTSGGFHTVGYLGDDMDEQTLVDCAAKENIIVAPLSRYCLAPVSQKGIVLGFGACHEHEIRNGVNILAKLRDKAWIGLEKKLKMDMSASPING
jgi:GntR family transcriptional regulator/MocR family aminotransferase